MLIDVRGLKHRIGERLIVDLPRLELSRGGHVVLLGPSGSGKTTLINILTGLVTPTEGSVTIDGQSFSALPPAARDRLRRATFGLVFQTLRLVSALTVRQNLALAQRLALGRVDAAEIEALIEQVGISHRRDALPRQLSQGEGQRAAIARAICVRPPVLVADEPTSALDDANAEAMVDLLVRTAEANGSTLLVATHDRRIRSRFPRLLELATPAAEPLRP